MMDHPAIAKVFDAGSTPDGQPYFVMEYVPGLPITEYCDQKQMSIRERLRECRTDESDPKAIGPGRLCDVLAG